ncbi:hypothetical protein [Streptomyces sp. Isolate_219]|uniref:hypothetical protein n=1 Tax=Streptomyces sp. Isolate_219 TaxID=2950110 RepID=UPI0021C82A9F|nr:hypothetical protein [Streptomyces sp. Isolate_219]MCR8576443.1 hypothetical protein [Streptomyces sp. Isolate_219]
MAKATLTEEIVRTDTVTLVLTMDEARALLSLTDRATGPFAQEGPALRIGSIRRALLDAEMGRAPSDKYFKVDGVVEFSAYVSLDVDA